jgi:hypothetical protein
MHDCVKARERLIDLVFDELEPEAKHYLLVELESCGDCLASYQSMTETLRVFDQAMEATVPDESYWPGYEDRLRTRLQEVRPGLIRRLKDWAKSWPEGWVAGFRSLTLRPVPLAAGLALILLATGLLWSRRWQPNVNPPQITGNIAEATPTPQPAPERRDDTPPAAPNLAENSGKRDQTLPKVFRPNRRSPAVSRKETGEEMVVSKNEPEPFDQPLSADSFPGSKTARHFEKAQLLLRSFRNAGDGQQSEKRAAVDLTYEKQLSRRLLYQNIILRREAESRGDLPAEGVLSNLEPFLLDIANLPARPSPDDLRGIRERLRRKEMIAALHIYSTPPVSPAFQNE